MNPRPVLVFDQDGYIYAYADIASACENMEVIAADDDEYEAFTVTGEVIEVSVTHREGEVVLSSTGVLDLDRMTSLIRARHESMRLASPVDSPVRIAEELIERSGRARRRRSPRKWLRREPR